MIITLRVADKGSQLFKFLLEHSVVLVPNIPLLLFLLCRRSVDPNLAGADS